MFDHVWVRVIMASLLFGVFGITETVAKLATRVRPPRVRRPLGSHLLGFVSVLLFYGLIGTDGRALWNGTGNQIGLVLGALAMVLRFAAQRGHGPVPHPDLAARILFFAALPLVVGSPRAWIAFTLPQILIAAYEARQRDAASIGSGELR